MACFLKQSFAQTCLKETDNGKLQQFNYSRSLITNRGTVERGKIHSARAMKQNTQTLQIIIMHHYVQLKKIYVQLKKISLTKIETSYIVALLNGTNCQFVDYKY